MTGLSIRSISNGCQGRKIFWRRARSHAARGRYSRQCGEGDARAQGPQRRARQVVRRTAHHQGRRPVAKEIELEDKFKNMGAQMLREVASKTSDTAGDGTTTATVLAQAIIREGGKSVAAGMNPMDLRRGIEIAVHAVVKDLEKRAKPVASSSEVAQVGTISSNGD